MATVRLTYNLKSEVLHKINELYSHRLQQAQKNINNNPVLGDKIYNNFVSQAEQNALAVLGKGWVNETERIAIRLDVQDKDGRNTGHVYTVTFSGLRPVPMHVASSYHPAVSVNTRHSCYTELLALHNEIIDIANERDELVTSIGRMMNQCGSLRQLLEIWPSALEYMPQRVITQHSAKTEKREKAEIVPPDERTQVLLLKARMLKP